MGKQEAEISVLSRSCLQKYDDNGTRLAPARLIAKKEAAERRTGWKKGRREGCDGNEGLDGEIWTSQRRKFNLLHVQRTSSSSGHGYRVPTSRRLYRRLLCDFLLVFINDVTCFRSRFYVDEVLSQKNTIQMQIALLYTEVFLLVVTMRLWRKASHKNTGKYCGKLVSLLGSLSISIFSSAKSFNCATSSLPVKKNLKIKVSLSFSGK